MWRHPVLWMDSDPELPAGSGASGNVRSGSGIGFSGPPSDPEAEPNRIRPFCLELYENLFLKAVFRI
jgi:hypothetical protein